MDRISTIFCSQNIGRGGHALYFTIKGMEFKTFESRRYMTQSQEGHHETSGGTLSRKKEARNLEFMDTEKKNAQGA